MYKQWLEADTGLWNDLVHQGHQKHPREEVVVLGDGRLMELEDSPSECG